MLIRRLSSYYCMCILLSSCSSSVKFGAFCDYQKQFNNDYNQHSKLPVANKNDSPNQQKPPCSVPEPPNSPPQNSQQPPGQSDHNLDSHSQLPINNNSNHPISNPLNPPVCSNEKIIAINAAKNTVLARIDNDHFEWIGYSDKSDHRTDNLTRFTSLSNPGSYCYFNSNLKCRTTKSSTNTPRKIDFNAISKSIPNLKSPEEIAENQRLQEEIDETQCFKKNGRMQIKALRKELKRIDNPRVPDSKKPKFVTDVKEKLERIEDFLEMMITFEKGNWSISDLPLIEALAIAEKKQEELNNIRNIQSSITTQIETHHKDLEQIEKSRISESKKAEFTKNIEKNLAKLEYLLELLKSYEEGNLLCAECVVDQIEHTTTTDLLKVPVTDAIIGRITKEKKKCRDTRKNLKKKLRNEIQNELSNGIGARDNSHSVNQQEQTLALAEFMYSDNIRFSFSDRLAFVGSTSFFCNALSKTPYPVKSEMALIFDKNNVIYFGNSSIVGAGGFSSKNFIEKKISGLISDVVGKSSIIGTSFKFGSTFLTSEFFNSSKIGTPKSNQDKFSKSGMLVSIGYNITNLSSR